MQQDEPGIMLRKQQGKTQEIWGASGSVGGREEPTFHDVCHRWTSNSWGIMKRGMRAHGIGSRKGVVAGCYLGWGIDGSSSLWHRQRHVGGFMEELARGLCS
jgi:hypothetical protein